MKYGLLFYKIVLVFSISLFHNVCLSSSGTTELEKSLKNLKTHIEKLSKSLFELRLNLQNLQALLDKKSPKNSHQKGVKTNVVNPVFTSTKTIKDTIPPKKTMSNVSINQNTVPPSNQMLSIATLNKGIKNSNGNDCFFSAAFQILSQIKPFIEELSKTPNQLPVHIEFLDFINSLRGGGSGKYNPADKASNIFRNFITNPDEFPSLKLLGPRLSEDTPAKRDSTGNPTQPYYYEQEDAQEFLSKFLDILTDRLPDLRKIFEFNERSYLNINNQLEWLTKQEVKNMLLALAIKTQDGKLLNTLEECIKHYFATATTEYTLRYNEFEPHKLLKGDYKALVEQKYEAKIRPILENPLPDIAIISLKRFEFDDYGNRSRLGHKVTFPLELLLETYDKNNSKKYQLFGIIVQTGSLTAGHYRAYAKNFSPNNQGIREWGYYNDGDASICSLQKIQDIANQKEEAGAPYVLLYESLDIF